MDLWDYLIFVAAGLTYLVFKLLMVMIRRLPRDIEDMRLSKDNVQKGVIMFYWVFTILFVAGVLLLYWALVRDLAGFTYG